MKKIIKDNLETLIALSFLGFLFNIIPLWVSLFTESNGVLLHNMLQSFFPNPNYHQQKWIIFVDTAFTQAIAISFVMFISLLLSYQSNNSDDVSNPCGAPDNPFEGLIVVIFVFLLLITSTIPVALLWFLFI